jgi:hypothetical protein
MEKLRRMWCRISGDGEKTLFGHTQDDELVCISRSYKGGGMQAAQPGDIVSFSPRAYQVTKCPPGEQVFKWFAQYPKLIAKRFEAAPGESAFEWKSEKESDADQFSAAFQI